MLIRLATRGSELARRQTRGIADRLTALHPDVEISEVIIKTQGDRDRTTAIGAQGGIGVFAKELEIALLEGRADAAVHSLKDLPTTVPEGLVVAAIPERASPWDAWISEAFPDLLDLPPGAVVATGSARRRAQILHRFPHLEVVGIRGNIDTRLRTYSSRGASGLVLAAAGLIRGGHHRHIRATFGPTEMTPAPGQGALAIECRAEDSVLCHRLSRLDDAATRAAVTAERSFLAALEGGCQLPIGALARRSGHDLSLLGMLADPDGERLLRMATEGSAAEPERVGEELAERMARAGGEEIMARCRGEAP